LFQGETETIHFDPSAFGTDCHDSDQGAGGAEISSDEMLFAKCVVILKAGGSKKFKI
jgi:hypothetical protein